MKKVIIILLGIIVYCSCQDDNNSNRVKPEVSFSDFQDPRDSKTYKCITIGGQTWMAENLKYRSPRGSMDGCYTYGEENMRAQDIVLIKNYGRIPYGPELHGGNLRELSGL